MTTIVLDVTGMTCQNCVNHVSQDLGELSGVTGVDVALDAGGASTVTVTSEADLDDAALREAVDEAGYAVVGIRRA